MKRVDEAVILDMINKNILVPGKYVVTENYLTVTADLYDKVSTYLSDGDYSSSGMGHCYEGNSQQWTFYINRW